MQKMKYAGNLGLLIPIGIFKIKIVARFPTYVSVSVAENVARKFTIERSVGKYNAR